MSCVARELLLEDMDPDQAWDAVVDMEAWLAEEAELELEPGAEGRFRLDDGSERRPGSPPVRISAPIDIAIPTQIVRTGGPMNCMAS